MANKKNKRNDKCIADPYDNTWNSIVYMFAMINKIMK
jgi:hypothetical protein